MSHITFYEKPGCANNARQKVQLLQSGHRLTVLNLLTESWTADQLRPFFGSRPVADWFNKASPRIKSGEIDPTAMDEDQALAAMLEDPLLIRRPLLQDGNIRTAGFDSSIVQLWLGQDDGKDRESCIRPSAQPAQQA